MRSASTVAIEGKTAPLGDILGGDVRRPHVPISGKHAECFRAPELGMLELVL